MLGLARARSPSLRVQVPDVFAEWVYQRHAGRRPYPSTLSVAVGGALPPQRAAAGAGPGPSAALPEDEDQVLPLAGASAGAGAGLSLGRTPAAHLAALRQSEQQFKRLSMLAHAKALIDGPAAGTGPGAGAGGKGAQPPGGTLRCAALQGKGKGRGAGRGLGKGRGGEGRRVAAKQASKGARDTQEDVPFRFSVIAARMCARMRTR